jgi:putative DNA primase/helicase
MNLDQFLQHPSLGKVTRTSWGYKGHCPSHDDKTESLSLKEGDDGRILVKCHAGCFAEDVVEAMGLTLRDLMPSTNGFHPPGELTVYPYRNEKGELLFEAVRTPDKRFWQRLPGQKGGSLGSVRRVLYGLPDLLQSQPGDTVFIVEGEKDAENLKKAGLIATTSPMGAGKWRDEYVDWLRENLPGCRFVILPDNDEAGEAHAATVHRSLGDHGLKSEIVRLPDLPEKGDVSDWIKAGNDPETLLTIETVAARPAVHVRTDDLPGAWGWDAPLPLYAMELPNFRWTRFRNGLPIRWKPCRRPCRPLRIWRRCCPVSARHGRAEANGSVRSARVV